MIESCSRGSKFTFRETAVTAASDRTNRSDRKTFPSFEYPVKTVPFEGSLHVPQKQNLNKIRTKSTQYHDGQRFKICTPLAPMHRYNSKKKSRWW
jgi:hypothetical protein